MVMTIWRELGIEPTGDRREIRRAYARRLRDVPPEGFERLREAYRASLEQADGPAVPVGEATQTPEGRRTADSLADDERAAVEDLLNEVIDGIYLSREEEEELSNAAVNFERALSNPLLDNLERRDYFERRLLDEISSRDQLHQILPRSIKAMTGRFRWDERLDRLPLENQVTASRLLDIQEDLDRGEELRRTENRAAALYFFAILIGVLLLIILPSVVTDDWTSIMRGLKILAGVFLLLPLTLLAILAWTLKLAFGRVLRKFETRAFGAPVPAAVRRVLWAVVLMLSGFGALMLGPPFSYMFLGLVIVCLIPVAGIDALRFLAFSAGIWLLLGAYLLLWSPDQTGTGFKLTVLASQCAVAAIVGIWRWLDPGDMESNPE